MACRSRSVWTRSVAAGLLSHAPLAALGQSESPRFTFDDAILSAIDTAGVPSDAAVADFNFDGAPDAIVALPTGAGDAGEVVLLLADPARPGSFVVAQRISVGSAPRGVAIADFNNDQRPDVAVAISAADESNVLVFVGAGELAFDSALSAPGLATSLAAADLNGDALPDLAVTSESERDGSGVLTIFVNQGDGVLAFGEAGAGNGDAAGGAAVFAAGASTSLLLGAKPKSVCPADVDADGDEDLIALSDGEVAVFGNVGNQGLRAAIPVFEPFAIEPVSAGALAETVADVNGDRLPDIIVASFGGFDMAGNPTPGDVAVLRNRSAGADQIAFDQPVVVLEGVQARSVAVADLDHDGDPDIPIIVGSVPNPTPVVAVLENRSSVDRLSFEPPQTLAQSEAAPAIVRTANVEGDADDDVIAFGADSLAQPTKSFVLAHRNRTPLPEDIDENGSVGPGDLLALLAAWSKSCAQAPCDEDINEDGSVGPGDLLRLLAAWGQRTM